MQTIRMDELRSMQISEGLILQGCGGNLQEWLDGVNEMFTEEGILQNGDTFKDALAFEDNGIINLLFGMDDIDLNIGKLAMWRLAEHSTFGGTWLSDYRVNRLGMESGEPEQEHNIEMNHSY